MKEISLPTATGGEIAVPSLVVGCMRLAEKEPAQVRALYNTAREQGLYMFDHADIYGSYRHQCEEIFGALQLSATERAEIVLQTKVGIRPGGYDSSAAHIHSTVDEALRALRTDYLDVLLIHRPDILTPPAEIAHTFAKLAAAGKVRAFGVSNYNARQMRELAAAGVTVCANQVQLSPAHPAVFAHELTVNMQEEPLSADRDGGIVAAATELGAVIQAYSPYQAPSWRGTFMGDMHNYPTLNKCLGTIANEHGVSPEAVVAAWILRPPTSLQVVTGTTTPARLAATAAGTTLTLTRAQWYEIYRAAGNTLP